LDADGYQYTDIAATPGSVNVGGSLSVQQVSPGSGLLPPALPSAFMERIHCRHDRPNRCAELCAIAGQ